MKSITRLPIGEEPVVGRRYLVPCIELTADDAQALWTNRLSAGIWPTLGPVHEDVEHIGFIPRHIHLDPRFMSDTQVRAMLVRTGERVGSILGRPLCLEDRFGMQHIGDKPDPKPLPRARTCYRRMPDHWDHLARVSVGADGNLLPGAPTWFATLEAAYASKRLATRSGKKADCRTCPHRGVPLGGLPLAHDSGVTCPGHGLRWHAETGRLLPRPRVAATSRSVAT